MRDEKSVESSSFALAFGENLGAAQTGLDKGFYERRAVGEGDFAFGLVVQVEKKGGETGVGKRVGDIGNPFHIENNLMPTAEERFDLAKTQLGTILANGQEGTKTLEEGNRGFHKKKSFSLISGGSSFNSCFASFKIAW